ncbi:MAG: type I restriction enzyme HsdR N-terminal domain-containing protein [Bacteroidota bacterium]
MPSNEINIDFSQYKALLSIKKEEDKHFIFDPIRKKHLVLLPEEFVRQLVVQHLLNTMEYPKTRIGIEVGLEVNQLKRRCDVLVYNSELRPFLMVETKSAKVPINQAVFEQIAQYNLSLKVPYLLVTNGLSTYCCKINFEEATFEFLDELPMWE